MAEKGFIPRTGTGVTLWWKDTAQAVVDYLEALLKLEVSPAGTGKLIVSRSRIFLQLDPKAIRSAARTPLQVYNSSAGSTPRISVEPGTFGENAAETGGDGTPTIGGTSIYANPAPTLTVGATDVLIYLHVSVNAEGQITGVTVEKTSGSIPTSDESDLYVTLAGITVTTGALASVTVSAPNLTGSQAYELCGGTQHLYLPV